MQLLKNLPLGYPSLGSRASQTMASVPWSGDFPGEIYALVSDPLHPASSQVGVG